MQLMVKTTLYTKTLRIMDAWYIQGHAGSISSEVENPLGVVGFFVLLFNRLLVFSVWPPMCLLFCASALLCKFLYLPVVCP